MFKDSYQVVGVMSGTSLDGVDLIYVTLSNSPNWIFQIHYSETVPYSDYWFEILSNSVHTSKDDLLSLNEDYTNELARIINDFIFKNNIQDIDLVCSHGHTVLHEPKNGFTLQIGNLKKIASLLQQNVVCDFRVQDVQLGGQGAPLVPMGDKLLFSEYDYCLNLGGFSNVSFDENGKRIAFDISPVNTVLNFYTNKLGFPYDDKGEFAKRGFLNNELFDELNNLDFYAANYPKSLGIEFVHSHVFPIISNYAIPIEDVLHTFVEHVACQIGKIITLKNTSLLITGGGAYNDFLIARIRHYLVDVNIVIPDKITLEFKEALIFALLGVLKIRNKINTLSSVTGAKADHSAGNVFRYKS